MTRSGLCASTCAASALARPILLRLAAAWPPPMAWAPSPSCSWPRLGGCPSRPALLAAGLAQSPPDRADRRTLRHRPSTAEGETKIIAPIAAHRLSAAAVRAGRVVQHLGRSDTRTPARPLERPDTLARRIRAEQPALVAASVLVNPVPVLQRLLANRDFQQAMAASYQRHDLGHFLVWTRNDLQIATLGPAPPD